MQDDVRERVWAKPAIREATAKFFRLCHAKEEITQLNVEIHHLQTAIHNEEKEVSQTIANLRGSQPLLACEFKCLHKPCVAVNAIHIHHLHQIEKQYGLASGLGTCKVSDTVDDHIGSSEPVAQGDSMPSGDATDLLAGFQDEDPVPGEDHVLSCNCLFNLFFRTFLYF